MQDENDIHNCLKYSDIKTPAPGFYSEMCSAQWSILYHQENTYLGMVSTPAPASPLTCDRITLWGLVHTEMAFL